MPLRHHLRDAAPPPAPGPAPPSMPTLVPVQYIEPPSRSTHAVRQSNRWCHPRADEPLGRAYVQTVLLLTPLTPAPTLSFPTCTLSPRRRQRPPADHDPLPCPPRRPASVMGAATAAERTPRPPRTAERTERGTSRMASFPSSYHSTPTRLRTTARRRKARPRLIQRRTSLAAGRREAEKPRYERKRGNSCRSYWLRHSLCCG